MPHHPAQAAHDENCSLFTTGKCDCYPTDEAATFLIRDLRLRIADLDAGLREARGALWELRTWHSKEVFERDPAVIEIDRLLKST